MTDTPRPVHKERHPVHVTLRALREVGNLRHKQPFGLIRDAIRAAGVGHKDFRIVHFAVLGNHLHLIVEADDEKALGRGMQRLGIRIAKRVNGLLRRNFRKHEAQQGRRCPRGWRDPCSSGDWFNGWALGSQPQGKEPPPVARPETWLLKIGWQIYGPISPDEIPASDRTRARAVRPARS